jgi:hypothetical protein
MGTGGGPTRQDLGLLKCVHKSPSSLGKVVVTFAGQDEESSGTAIFRLSAEDAEYFAVGQSYEFTATRP